MKDDHVLSVIETGAGTPRRRRSLRRCLAAAGAAWLCVHAQAADWLDEIAALPGAVPPAQKLQAPAGVFSAAREHDESKARHLGDSGRKTPVASVSAPRQTLMAQVATKEAAVTAVARRGFLSQIDTGSNSSVASQVAMTGAARRDFLAQVDTGPNSSVASQAAVTAAARRDFLAQIDTVPNSTGASQADEPTEYVFDTALLSGNISQADLARINADQQLQPGSYAVDLYLNNTFVATRDVRFVEGADAVVRPLVPRSVLLGAGVRPELLAADGAPIILEDAIPGADSRFTLSTLRLDLSVPQVSMMTLPRGYVSPALLDRGETVAFTNYRLNQYHLDSRGRGYDSTFLSLDSGINLGAWRLRNQASLSLATDTKTRWRQTRSYVQRSLPQVSSELTLGDNFSSGRLFPGVAYRGVELRSDTRMVPDSLRGYAPVVRGTAKTHARVVVSQNGAEIYETSVPPGAFEIRDLYPTSYDGDLEVEVIEANGERSRFWVPFAAVPESLRPSTSRYAVTAGKLRRGDEFSDAFADFTYRRGISNALTVNSGGRFAEGYQAYLLGVVHASSIGAFGANVTYTRADLPGGTESGHQLRLSYAKTFQATQTTLSLANYRYSSGGYRGLGEVIGERHREPGEVPSTSQSQRSRYDLSLTQSLGGQGTLAFTGSIQDYRDGRERDKQLQASYSRTLANRLGLSVSVSRQLSGAGVFDGVDDTSRRTPGRSETFYGLSVSMPFGAGGSLGTSVTYDRSGVGLNSQLSAPIDDNKSYGLSLSRGPGDAAPGSLGASFNAALPKVSLGLNASRGEDSWQTSANAAGAMALHSGGLTLGPYVGDTFALVEAKGAAGATVSGGRGLRIDDNGYALVPSLSPFRFNDIRIDGSGMRDDVELKESQRRIAPMAGAAVKVRFATLSGQATLLDLDSSQGRLPPLGSRIMDETGSEIGMVGQGGQSYARVPLGQSTLSVRWGKGDDQQCEIDYRPVEAASDAMPTAAMARVKAVCL